MAGGGRRVLQRRLAAAFTCLFVMFTLSSHRLILASQFTSSFEFVSQCAGLGQPRPLEFIRIPGGARDGSSDPWPTTRAASLGSIASSRTDSTYSSGVGNLTSRVMYWKPVQLRSQEDRRPLSFSTTFRVLVYDIVQADNGTRALQWRGSRDGVEGLAFIIVPDAYMYTVGQGGGYLGFLTSDANASSTTSAAAHAFAVELDFVKNEEFQDADPNHVGIDVGNMTSVAVAEAPPFTRNDWEIYTFPSVDRVPQFLKHA